MTRIVWSPQALADVEAIRAYIAEGSQLYADLVVRRIVASVERLVDFPESGRMVPERKRRPIREVVVGPFRVVYRLHGGNVEIATVFRASRLFPRDVL